MEANKLQKVVLCTYSRFYIQIDMPIYLQSCIMASHFMSVDVVIDLTQYFVIKADATKTKPESPLRCVVLLWDPLSITEVS